jgi:hypothetical protein
MTNACVSISRVTSRATPLNRVHVFGVRILISYNTPVAFEWKGGRARRVNTWGPTTGRHLKEAGAYFWLELEEDEFNKKMNDAVFKSMADRIAQELK